jgi:hypothetical protein
VNFWPSLHVEGNELNPPRLDTIVVPLAAFEKRNVPPTPKIASQYVVPFFTRTGELRAQLFHAPAFGLLTAHFANREVAVLAFPL